MFLFQRLLADVTNWKERTMRIGIVKAADSMGHIVGNIFGGKLYHEFASFYLNYGVSIGISIICIIYILCFVVESLEMDPTISQSRKRLFCLENVKQGFITCFKDRPERNHVILLLIDFAILVFATNTRDYDFLMVRKR